MRAEANVGLFCIARLATGALLALIVAAGLLYFYRLDAQSFWLDELWTAAASDPALPPDRWLAEWVLPDVHPPLYLLLVREWRRIFGDDEFALRSLSGALSLAMVAAILLLHRWTPVVRQPLGLAAWFACSVGVVLYAQDARPYALVLLLTTVGTLLAVAIARRMDQRSSIFAPALALALVMIITEYTHYFGALVAGGLFGALFLFALRRHPQYLWGITATGAGSAAALLPWLAFHVPHISDKFGGNFWVSNNWTETLPAYASFAAGTPALYVLIAAAAGGTLALRPRLLREPACSIPLLAMGLMLLGAVLISLHTPVITRRNLLILLPPFYVFAIVALTSFLEDRSDAARVAAVLTPVLFAASSLSFAAHRVVTEEKDQWRDAAARIAALSACRDAILQVYYWPEEIYAYYLPPPQRHNLRRVAVTPHEPIPAPLLHGPDGACPVILWTGHTVGAYLVRQVLDRLGLDRRDVVVWRTKGNMLILDRRLLAAGRGSQPL